MKKIKLTAVIAGLLIGTSAFAIVPMTAIMNRVTGIVSALEDKDEQIIFVQMDSIEKDQKSTQTYTLQEDSTYKIVVVGDEKRVTDIDLRVLDENDNEIGEDSDEQNIAMVRITPKWTGKFKIQVWAAEMKAKDAFYGIVIARED